MKILTPNHKYELANFENPDKPGQVIQFIEKDYKGHGITIGPGFRPGTDVVTINDGTTNEEVLTMLIDRLVGLNAKVPSRESSIAITKCEEALLWLNHRTMNRRVRGVEGTMKP